MEPIKFKGMTTIIAEDQPEYVALPARFYTSGQVETCWGLSLCERLKVLFTGKIWLSVLTFNQPLQPVALTVNKPFTTAEPSAHSTEKGN